jgi:hypothetical protein
MGKDRQWISPHDRRRSRVLRKRLETNPNNVIPDCKGNPNSLREQLSLKTNQGESKENALRNPD